MGAASSAPALIGLEATILKFDARRVEQPTARQASHAAEDPFGSDRMGGREREREREASSTTPYYHGL